MASIVHDLLSDPQISKEGLDFLQREFLHEQTHEAGLKLLLGVLQDKRFLDQCQVSGVDLIAFVLQQKRIENDFKDLVVKALDNVEVKEETVKLLEHIMKQEKTHDIFASYLNLVFLRPDVLQHLTTLLVASTCQALGDEATKNMFQNFVLQVVENKHIKEGLFENYVYSPVRSFFSFGYQQAEQERIQMEKAKMAEYYKQRDEFSQKEDKNKYPGYEQS